MEGAAAVAGPAPDEPCQPLEREFGSLVKSLEAETREATRLLSLVPLLQEPITKGGSSRQGGDGEKHKLWGELHALDGVLSDLERRTEGLNVVVAQRRLENDSLEAMLANATLLAAEVQHMTGTLPKYLPGDVAPVSAPPPPAPPAAGHHGGKHAAGAGGEAQQRRGNKAGGGQNQQQQLAQQQQQNAQQLAGSIALVTAAELQGVPKTTRGRLQLDQVNAVVTELQAALSAKHALLARPRSKLSDKHRRQLDDYTTAQVPEHGGAPFLTEAEVRTCSAGAMGARSDAAARAVLAVLRALKRLRPVRAAGTMTYVAVAQ